MADEEYNRKLESLQQYIPFLNNMIVQLKDPRKKNREQQLTKMVSLHSMITDKKKKLKLETLIKCEDVILKLYEKVRSSSASNMPLSRSAAIPTMSTPYSPITPSSPSPPRDVPKTKPVVIPTEKIVDRESKLLGSSSVSSYKQKIDVYSSAGDSLKSKTKPKTADVFVKSAPDMSKPPISIEDLEALQADTPHVDCEKMSLNELTELKEKLQRQLSKQVEEVSNNVKSQPPSLPLPLPLPIPLPPVVTSPPKTTTDTINTTVRNTTILTKKAVEKETKQKTDSGTTSSNESKPVTNSKTPLATKPVKVLKESDSIFGSTLSSIDNKILECATNKNKDHKERRNSNSGIDKAKDKERRNSKDEKKVDSSSHKSSKEKTDNKKSSNSNSDKDNKHESLDKKLSEHKHKDNKKDSDKKPPKDDIKKKSDDSKKHDSKNKDRDKEKKKGESDKVKEPAIKKPDDKDNKDKEKPTITADLKKSEPEKTEEKPKQPIPNKPKPETEEKPATKPPVEVQTYKRLADKYNPKPRKPSIETLSVPEVPKNVSESIESSMKKAPASIPFLDNKGRTSPPKPISVPINPMNIPLLSPTSSVTSMDNEVAAVNRKIPQQVSNILSNPNATEIINSVVNQFKAIQSPNLLMPQNTFHQQQQQQQNFIQNDQSGVQFGNQNPQFMPGFQNSNQGYWGNQNQPQRPFTPLATTSNQFQDPQQHDYFPPARSATPAPFQTHNTQPPPPLLSPQFERFDRRPHQEDNLFGNRDRDMRPNNDWRRDKQWNSRESARDPRLHRNPNPRNYREDPRSTRRDFDRDRDRDWDNRDNRTTYNRNDPRSNRYSSSSRFNRERDNSRSRSVSRDKDESFMSPLDSLYTGGEGYRKTGKGYGVQPYKMRKIKREVEDDPPMPLQEPEADPDKTTHTVKESLEHDKETSKDVEIIESEPPCEEPANVSSSTEIDNKEAPAEDKTKKPSNDASEISSTNEVTVTESEEPKPKDPDQTEIINKFLKQLLDNETTRAAASLFIDNVSHSVDDERLKMIVQTVKAASKPEKKTTMSKAKILAKRKRERAELLARRQLLRKMMRKKMKAKLEQTKDEVAETSKEEEVVEEKVEVEEDNIVVSVGERIKSRRRCPPKKRAAKKKTELDLLREDIHEMFIRDGVLTATGKRMCSILKKDATDTPKTEPKRRTRSTAEKSGTEISSDKLKAMSNVRVLLPKISVENLDYNEDNKRYSLRKPSKATKSYVEDSDDDKEQEKKKEPLKRSTKVNKNYNEESEEEKVEKEVEDESESTKDAVEDDKDKKPKKPMHRKRSNAWASGVLPKIKRKRKDTKSEEKPSDDSTELIEPDKDYFVSQPFFYRMKCKLCPFLGKNISRHYRDEHPDSEVLSSRLSPEKAAIVIRQSEELKLDESPEEKMPCTRKCDFKCRFCDLEMNTKLAAFYDHVTTHTGEYRHVCGECSFSAANCKPVRFHSAKIHGKITTKRLSFVRTKIYGYICRECNFVQMNKKLVENHVNIYHLGEGNKILKIFLSSLDNSVKSDTPNSDNTSINEKSVEDDDDDSIADNDNNDDSMELEEEAPLIEEPEPKKAKLADESEPKKAILADELEPKKAKLADELEPKKAKLADEESPVSVPSKPKEIDMTVFTCKTNLDEENEAIEKERLKLMTELNDSVKTSSKRQSLNFVDQLSNRLMQEEKEQTPPPVSIKEEPVDLDDVLERTPDKVNQKPTKTIDETPANSNIELPPKNNTMIQGMIQKLQGILKDETTIKDGPPPLTPLIEKPKESLKTVLRAGFLNIVKDQDEIEYVCRVPSCLFTTKSRDRFISHWQEDHTRVNQTYKLTKCKICSGDISASLGQTLLMNFFTHVEDEHVNVTKPILRTRRLSGDKLSAPKDPDPTDVLIEENAVEIEKSDENPFPFKISGVMSLAEDPVPPLSPLREKSNQPIKCESVVLKETKLLPSEKKIAWKSPEAMKKFMQCPRELYKCPQYLCKFATNWRKFFENHIKGHVAVKDEIVGCVYCDVKTPLSHSGLHIDLRHGNCLYSCSQCLYRALTREYVLVHMKSKHKETDIIISLPPRTSKTTIMGNQKQLSVEEACPPYVCGHKECRKEYLYEDEFRFHLEKAHDSVSLCGFQRNKPCAYKTMSIDDIIDHWRDHGCYRYHCLVCKFGSMEIYTMLEHFSVKHPNIEPSAVERFKGPGSCMFYTHYTKEAFATIKHLNTQVLDSVNTQQCTVMNALPTPTESVSGKDDNLMPQPFTLVPIAIIPSTSDNTFIPILPKPTEVQSVAEPQQQEPDDNFILIVDDDTTNKDKDQSVDSSNDLNATDPLSLFDDSDSQDVNETGDLKNFGLIGYQLYRCAFCDISFSNSKGFKTHCGMSKLCQDPTNRPYKCVHCKRQFKNPHGLLEHIQYHGQLRFMCSLCCKKFPSSFSLKSHMRVRHNITSTVTTPLVPNKNNLDRDEFVLRPKPAIEAEASREITSSGGSPFKTVFSPSEINSLPKRYIFCADVKCAICSYSTKVRTNLVRHLQFHLDEKSVPDTAPVNPVPCLDKNEKMFDKMTNLAISSFSGGNASRMGGPSGAKTKVEDTEVKDIQLPAYVPSHRRYVCCVPNCSYLCLEESNLRHHLFALHSLETDFTCPHCRLTLKTDIEGCLKHLKLHDLHLYKCSFCTYVHNLRHKVEKHSGDKHPDQTPRTITIRALEAEIIDSSSSGEKLKKSEAQASGSNTLSNSAPTVAQSVKCSKPWHCGMCKYKCANRDDIVTHIFNKHEINAQYKCTLCTYKTDEKSTFAEHFNENHPSSDIDIINVYYKSEGGGANAATSQKQFDTTPLWQRDRPRVRHIRGILFEETSPQKLKKNVASTITSIASTSTSSKSSNLDLAIDAVAKGIDQKSIDDAEHKNQLSPIILIEDDDDEDDGLVIDKIDTNLAIDEIKTESGENEQLLSAQVLMNKYGKFKEPVNKCFRCPICLKYTTRKISLFVYHLLAEFKCSRFRCKTCGFLCLSLDSMAFHCQQEHNNSLNDNVIDLPLEKSIEYWIQLLLKHQARFLIAQLYMPAQGEDEQTSLTKAQCEYCHKWFKNIHILKEHELFHWAEHNYLCGHCSSEFPIMDNLFQHHFMNHPNLECSIKSTGPMVDKVIANLKAPPKQIAPSSSSSNILFYCLYCLESETSLTAIKEHTINVHPTMAFNYKKVDKTVYFCCKHCHERDTRENLETHHKEKHPNQKFDIYQIICFECSQLFQNLRNLRVHYLTAHPNKKLAYSFIENKPCEDPKGQLICLKCPFRSNNVGGIRVHVRKHVRPIDCLICGATFIYPTEARAHHSREHADSPENIEENKERLKEYEEMVKTIVAKREAAAAPTTTPAPRRMLARKSTGAPFNREPKKEEVEQLKEK